MRLPHYQQHKVGLRAAKEIMKKKELAQPPRENLLDQVLHFSYYTLMTFVMMLSVTYSLF